MAKKSVKEQEEIKYFIDKIVKDEENRRAIVQGWAFNTKTKEPVELFVLGQEAEGVNFKRDFRIDVNNKYVLSDDAKVGFIIEFDEKSYGKKLRLKLKDNTVMKIVKINLKKNYDYLKKPNLFNAVRITNIATRTIGYLGRNGLKNTIRKVKFELKYKNQENYDFWIDVHEDFDSKKVLEEIKHFAYNPKISIIMPVYNVEEQWLRACIDSVLNQSYKNWELCIADDNSSDAHIKPLLESCRELDPRIKIVYRTENGHISEASNSALALATGEFIGLLDNDDTLADFALFEVVKVLNENPEADLIYSDEDKLSEDNKRSQPFFKTDWAPDILLATNYVCHFGVYRKRIIDEIGGFRKGYEGAQDYDLVLRFTEKTDKIHHIQKVLYHWRMIQNSTAVNPESKGYAFEAGLKSLEDALTRRGIKGTVSHGAFPGVYDIEYEVFNPGLVSVIIPTRDNPLDLKACIDSIFEKTVYEKFEIIVADNGSEKDETFMLFDYYSKKYPDQFKVIRIDIPFNFSKINNLAVEEANGEYLLFLNNDITVITKGWMTRMVSFAQQEHIGAVGAKLYYPDNTIQHAGVLLGMGGVAGHGHCGYPRGDYGYFGKLVINNNYTSVTAACLMVKRSDFDMVGGFEEKLTIAFNDVDFCLKLYEKGKYNIWLHNVELYHYESKSRGAEDTYSKYKRFNSEIKYMKDHWLKYIKDDPFYNRNLTRVDGNYAICVDINGFIIGKDINAKQSENNRDDELLDPRKYHEMVASKKRDELMNAKKQSEIKAK
ncbi:glycosyltransferase family 2 protein [Acetobacterium bakii]|uniref:glycosyltransferase family 2 protein n=1 Tax=Acetobacterium bakii TaxID=52689 RepID=UPI0009F81CAC|nr:glycosyltransferase family 2 protein [Acetobacterium bakii]